MADMALDLAKKAVEGTVSSVLAAIDEDTKLKAAMKQDLRFIVGEFQMMESFLEMANDNKKRTSNKVVKTWVRQLREQAFDVEDCVEFVIHVDTTSARVRWLSWLWHLVPLPSCMTPAWVQDLNQAFAQLKQIKAGVEDVSQRYTRYNVLGGDDSGLSTTPPLVPPEQLDAAAFPSTVDILRDLWKAKAKQSSSSKCNLKYLVADGPSNELRVISVWRSAGVDLEAADILNAIYSDRQICEEFKARAKLKLMHPFNIQEFLKSLLHQLYVTSPQQDNLDADLSPAGHTSVVHRELKKLLSKHKYLIILEDLSSTVEWDLIRSYLKDHGNGSRIVISTQQVGIALWCSGEPYRVLQLALLPNNDGYIYAFYKPYIGLKELVRQLGQRRVISLWGDKGGDTRSLVREVYNAIKFKTAKFKGVNFEYSERIERLPSSPFSLECFCRRLPGYVCYGYEDPERYFAEFWRERVCGFRWLIVIEGLQSKEDWDLIKDKLVPENTESCFVIIANEEAVAKYIADEDNSWRKMDYEEQEEANNAAIIGSLFAEKEKYYSWGHDRFRSHGCSGRIDEALFKFEPFVTQDQDIKLVTEIIWGHVYDCGVRAVWGTTGVGKSALVRLAYYTVMVGCLKLIQPAELPKRDGLSYACLVFDEEACPYQRFGWVNVPEPFDLAELSRRLLLDFSSDDPVEMEKTAVAIIHGHNPIQGCYEIMRRQRCLVVIDGLRSTRDWDSIQQAFWCHHHPHSSILVITTDESIAKHCVPKDDSRYARTIPMRALDDKSALELFIKVAENQNNESISEKNLKHAERIVPKCGGLPKIIDAVARFPCSFWENINNDLVTELKKDAKLRGVLSWMRSYIDDSSDSVKPCIFYLSVFPINYKIRKAHLLRRWIAEGYCRDTTGCSAKENAESLFHELIKQDIIKYIGSMWHVNGFFCEYIISQPMEDNLVFALEGQRKPNSQRTVQHLTIMEDWEREKHVFESIDVSRLRSLTVYGKWEPFFISDKMKRIRVLDLEGTSGVENCCLKRIFEILMSLKFICLRGCKSITYLPKTLGGLRQLESLDVSGTSIVTLPRAIIKLQKIQYIRAGCKFLPDHYEDCTSSASEVGGQKKLVGCCWTSTKSSQDSDDEVGSQQPSGTTATAEAEGSDGGHQGQHQHHKQRYHKIKKMGRRWKSRLSSCSWFAHNNINGGVEVPVGIEDMPSLHTLGTVNISRGGGKAFLTMFKLKTTLPQLLKLSVCGINKESWKDLCDALSAHDHLESLSLGLDEEFTEDSCFDKPPKALKSLKLYGNIHKLPAWPWIKDDTRQVVNKLEKFDLEVIISSQEEMDQLVESLPRTGIPLRLCIKSTHQVTVLEFKRCNNNSINIQVLKIDCSSDLQVSIYRDTIATYVNVLIIHCSPGARDFRIISSNERGLNNLLCIETVSLKGYDEEAEYVAHLKKHVDAHPRKPIFEFEKLKSA